MRISLLLAVCLVIVQFVWSAAGGPPSGYYSAIEGKKDSVLKSTLGALTYANFTTMLSYGSGSGKTWQGLWQTDRNKSDNSVIDMYSTVKRYFNPSDTCASVTNCDIEHMFANSWWGAKAGNEHAYCDLHHLVPSDYSANRSKSNRGPGIPTDTTFNNGVWVNGKDGNHDNLAVFCPPDEYKGDFARAFFYIATTYGDTVVWQSEAIPDFMTNSSWQEFLPYTRDLLLAWHRQDPVSDKERVRMNTVYHIQGNRNPFIDYPCLAEYIWGDKSGQTVALASLTCAYDDGFADEGCATVSTPLLTSPTGSISVGATSAGNPITKTIQVKGINLTNGNLTLALSGTNAGLFSLSTTSVSKANALTGYDVTITYTPMANGSHNATLTISGCGITAKTFTVSGSCSNIYTATWMAKGSQHAQTTAPDGQTPTLPSDPTDCSATRVFMGWTEQSSVSSRPADLFTEAPVLTSNKTFYAVFADEETGSGGGGSVTYTFSSTAWAASPSNWTSGKDAYRYKSGQGVWVSTSYTGANATCPTSYSNISSVVVNYCTNASAGAGNVTITIDESSVTQAVTSTGGSSLRDLSFDFSSAHPTGTPNISVECTTNSIYINSVTITYGPPTSYSYYSLSCSTAPAVSVTATFMNGASTYDTKSGNAGQAVSVTDPTPCEGHTFAGWSLNTYAASNTSAPTIDFTGTLPSSDATYHAVYSHTEAGGGTGAPVGTTLWSENFGSYEDGAHTTGTVTTATGRTIYNNGSVTYSYADGGSSTKIYGGYKTIYAGGEKPELMIGQNQGYFSISGIPTAGADTMTLTFKTNRAGNAYFTISSGTTGINVIGTTFEGVTDGLGVGTCNIKNTGGVANFNLTITNPHGNQNDRVDDFLLAIKSTNNASTTYYSTSADCGCTVTVTAVSDDDSQGIVTVTEQ